MTSPARYRVPMSRTEDRPTRLDLVITWTGVGAATALSAALMILGVWGLLSSSPRPDQASAG